MTGKKKRRFGMLLSRKKAEAGKRVAIRQSELAALSVQGVGDLADDAERENERDMQYFLEEHDLQELRRLEEAQLRLDNGDFGVCRVCGASIETSRLLVIPETQLCRACAEEGERERRAAIQVH
jgi:DnaK suppressor protein